MDAAWGQGHLRIAVCTLSRAGEACRCHASRTPRWSSCRVVCKAAASWRAGIPATGRLSRAHLAHARCRTSHPAVLVAGDEKMPALRLTQMMSCCSRSNVGRQPIQVRVSLGMGVGSADLVHPPTIRLTSTNPPPDREGSGESAPELPEHLGSRETQPAPRFTGETRALAEYPSDVSLPQQDSAPVARC